VSNFQIAAYALDILMASLFGDFFNNIGAKQTLVGAPHTPPTRHDQQLAAAAGDAREGMASFAP